MSEQDDLRELRELTEENDESEPLLEDGASYRANQRDPYDLDDDEPGVLKENARMWAKAGDVYFPSDITVKTLPPGQYTVEYSHGRGLYFSPKAINLDELMILPDSASEEIIENIELFWTKEKLFRELGFLWKRGVLLYGPAGSGKTSTLQLITKKIIDRGGIAVYVKDPNMTAQGLELLRRIEPVRPIIVLVEDIDAIQHRHGEAELLAMLDGELQIDNVVFIATTNYPEKLDKRLVNRPSRFDIVRKIGMPSAEARRIYLEDRNETLANDPVELERWVEATDGFSIAHLKEVMISVEVLDQDFYNTVERLRIMMDEQPSSDEDNEKPIGFMATGKRSATVRRGKNTRLEQIQKAHRDILGNND